MVELTVDQIKDKVIGELSKQFEQLEKTVEYDDADLIKLKVILGKMEAFLAKETFMAKRVLGPEQEHLIGRLPHFSEEHINMEAITQLREIKSLKKANSKTIVKLLGKVIKEIKQTAKQYALIEQLLINADEVFEAVTDGITELKIRTRTLSMKLVNMEQLKTESLAIKEELKVFMSKIKNAERLEAQAKDDLKTFSKLDFDILHKLEAAGIFIHKHDISEEEAEEVTEAEEEGLGPTVRKGLIEESIEAQGKAPKPSKAISPITETPKQAAKRLDAARAKARALKKGGKESKLERMARVAEEEEEELGTEAEHAEAREELTLEEFEKELESLSTDSGKIMEGMKLIGDTLQQIRTEIGGSE